LCRSNSWDRALSLGVVKDASSTSSSSNLPSSSYLPPSELTFVASLALFLSVGSLPRPKNDLMFSYLLISVRWLPSTDPSPQLKSVKSVNSSSTSTVSSSFRPLSLPLFSLSPPQIAYRVPPSPLLRRKLHNQQVNNQTRLETEAALASEIANLESDLTSYDLLVRILPPILCILISSDLTFGLLHILSDILNNSPNAPRPAPHRPHSSPPSLTLPTSPSHSSASSLPLVSLSITISRVSNILYGRISSA